MSTTAALLCLLCYLVVCQSSFIIRVRLKNGKVSRLNMKAASTFNDLHVVLQKIANLSESDSDHLLLGKESKPVSLLQGNRTKLVEAGMLHGDMVRIISTTGNSRRRQMPQTGIVEEVHISRHTEQIKEPQKNNRKRIITMADISEGKTSLVKIARQPSNDKFSVEIPASVAKVLKGWESSNAGAASSIIPRTALLLGKRRISTNLKNASQLIETVAIEGLVQLETPLCAKDASQAEQLTDMNQWLLEKAFAVGKAMDLVVVGCLVQSAQVVDAEKRKASAARRPKIANKVLGLQQANALSYTSTDVALSPTSTDIGICLKLRDAVASCRSEKGLQSCSSELDPFILLKSVHNKSGDADEVSVETFHLSDQALSLHAQGLIRPTLTTSSSSKTGSPLSSTLSSPGRRASRLSPKGASPGVNIGVGAVNLLGPVLLPNFVESRQVDSQLLVVPVAVRTATTTIAAVVGGEGAQKASFPSLQQMQTDDSIASEAKDYLRKLLRQVLGKKKKGYQEALSRLWDVNLLLYLNLLLDEPVFHLLCEYLRRHYDAVDIDDSAIARKNNTYFRPMPVEVAVALENLLHEL